MSIIQKRITHIYNCIFLRMFPILLVETTIKHQRDKQVYLFISLVFSYLRVILPFNIHLRWNAGTILRINDLQRFVSYGVNACIRLFPRKDITQCYLFTHLTYSSSSWRRNFSSSWSIIKTLYFSSERPSRLPSELWYDTRCRNRFL